MVRELGLHDWSTRRLSGLTNCCGLWSTAASLSCLFTFCHIGRQIETFRKKFWRCPLVCNAFTVISHLLVLFLVKLPGQPLLIINQVTLSRSKNRVEHHHHHQRHVSYSSKNCQTTRLLCHSAELFQFHLARRLVVAIEKKNCRFQTIWDLKRNQNVVYIFSIS